jgi:hypothetical protein
MTRILRIVIALACLVPGMIVFTTRVKGLNSHLRDGSVPDLAVLGASFLWNSICLAVLMMPPKARNARVEMWNRRQAGVEDPLAQRQADLLDGGLVVEDPDLHPQVEEHEHR